MSIREKLGEDLKEAMRAKDTVRLETIRGVKAAILQREVDGGKELDDAAIAEVLRSLRKQRQESIEQYTAGGRTDLADKETREKQILESYLPQGPDAATLERVVREAIAELGANSAKDMGRVMTAVKPKLQGADGKVLSELVKRLLTGG